MATQLASAMTSASRRPIVAVIGTTGVGKSNLAVSLAQSLSSRDSTSPPSNSVVLSADSMQLYKGLDVITNKITNEEKGGIEHWGIDVVRPGETWELGKWCTEADKKISSLGLSTLPIVCGGTHYFIQHFLFPPDELQLQRTPRNDNPQALRWTPPCPCPPVTDLDPELKALLETFWRPDAVYPSRKEIPADSRTATATPTISRPVANDDHEFLSIWRVLQAVDPKEAARWHWRDGRKVRRGLERWWERGGGEVESTKEAEGSGRRAKFRTLVFWVYEPMATLRERLDGRVDKMVQNGLLDEILELRQSALELYGTADNYTEGIFQSIGYKEFSELALPLTDRTPQFESMLARTKLSTQQYAKSQIKWIKKQLLPTIREARSHGDDGDVSVYVVPGGPPGESVAQSILDKFLAGAELPDPSKVGHPDANELLSIVLESPDVRVPDTADRQVLNSRKICDICSKATPDQPFSVRSQEWDEHLKSKVHRRHSKFANITREEWIEQQKAKGLAQKAERERTMAAMTPTSEP